MVSYKQGQRKSSFSTHNSILLVQVFRVKVKSAEMCTIVIRPPSKHTCQGRERKGLNPVYLFILALPLIIKVTFFKNRGVTWLAPKSIYSELGPPPAQLVTGFVLSCPVPVTLVYISIYFIQWTVFCPWGCKVQKDAVPDLNFHTAAQCNKCYKWAPILYLGAETTGWCSLWFQSSRVMVRFMCRKDL